MSEERIRRPALDRMRPIRDGSALFGSRPADAGPEAPASVPAPEDVISRSVDLGYRVIDEYIRRGQRAAERARRGTYDAGALADDLQDVGARMIQYVSDFTGTLVEFLERSGVGGAAARGPQAPPASDGVRDRAGGDTRDPPQASARTSTATADASPAAVPNLSPLRVHVELVTRRQVQLALDLDPLSSGRRLVIHGLRAAQLDRPRIADVSFDPTATTLRLHIADEQPAGTYRGLIVDEQSNLPVGTLTVVLAASI